ncbi:MAG: (2Fe-2S)-binding protein [bacterium]|nr:(2Fe-2S)-binding protein [bacterium]MCP5068210.1 (2Fe-2S)-binding protein [bacterium]
MTRMHITTCLNGEEIDFLCEPHQSLLHVLRDELKLTGTKEGCGTGDCGACSVILDGRLVNSCLTLAAEVQGRSVETVEGVAGPVSQAGTVGLHPIQQKLLEHAALQCGVCTPGIVMAVKALLDREPDPSEREVRYWLAGNLCRCTGYDKIVRAVLDAAAELRNLPEERQPA